VLIYGTPDDADNHAREILRRLERSGYKIQTANIVRNEDGWGGSPITTEQAPNVEVSGPEAALSPEGRARLTGSAAG